MMKNLSSKLAEPVTQSEWDDMYKNVGSHPIQRKFNKSIFSLFKKVNRPRKQRDQKGYVK